jgi:uncharacterized protein YjbJ (UPF0337 family)
MKSSMIYQAEGTFHQVRGSFKEFAGRLSDNSKLEAAGIREKITGRVQERIGQIKKVWGN